MEYFNKLDEKQKELIRKHLDLVIEANKSLNLTRIDTVEDAMLLHVEDSLTALEEFQNAPKGPYGDLGSGAGYPGIPMAIVSGRKTTLIDARKKKALALDEIVKNLGLEDQVRSYAGRAELLARTEAGIYAVLTARALSSLPVLLELASPLLKHKGRLICYKANVDDEEIDHARRIRKKTGMEMVSDRSFILGKDISRRIITFDKTSHPTVNLPRKEGEAQRNPLL